jgi:NTE family protein
MQQISSSPKTVPREARAVSSARRPIGLALQGGGSLGAFTWGVLDRILASRRLQITTLTGTSAGAFNAAIVAGALATGKADEARRRLRSFWVAVARPEVAAILEPLERSWHDAMGTWLASAGRMSPYVTNPLGVNPLRDLIEAHVDVDAIRSDAAPALYVTVTNVRTGLPRVITNATITIDALLASACLPHLFHAIELDGEAYWDGGYSGNPTLWPMIASALARDLIVVQLTPDAVTALPTGAASIQRRIDEIVFHSSLVAEMQAIRTMRALVDGRGASAGALDIRLHRIGPPLAALLNTGSGLERSRAWIEQLHAAGRRAGSHFLLRHGRDVGVRETLDIEKVFVDGHPASVQTSVRTPRAAPTIPAYDIGGATRA